MPSHSMHHPHRTPAYRALPFAWPVHSSCCFQLHSVDDMRTKAGTSATDKESFEKLLDGVQVMTAILTGSIKDGEESSDYFRSVPCQHELGRALQNGSPVVFVLETSRTHGGISLEAHRRDCPEHLRPLLDKGTIIEWHRVRAYQDVSLIALMQELMQEQARQRGEDTIFLRREVVLEPI